MSDPLFDRVVALAPKLKARAIDWAIGGALAMSAWGYTRETRDIDVFFSPDDRDEVLALLAQEGMPLIEVFEDLHYAFVPDPRDPDARIDVLFPYDRPDISAVGDPREREVRGARLPVWDIDLIAVAKLQGERDKDRLDLEALYALRLFDVARVRRMLEDEEDREALARLAALVERERGAGPRLRRRVSSRRP